MPDEKSDSFGASNPDAYASGSKDVQEKVRRDRRFDSIIMPNTTAYSLRLN
ncbi:hypothetical protein GWO43_21005 [candidate division KSB1 bacterium]|nr:hypothetical protein [candidate division KSB1 bacterium]NIR70275.1 hypothetical protein [candidate division KSB1 bacterium]NIS26545.1 hypothetical protein [candidate division KSB1 bacterium]NIT73308.1 hypothetical protein [candidate division KSB1 bacterium]NIU23931.1 hypothetical protein [candidate division KSB1 bacterium]